ncbi:RICIN domain-containing protein, partial [Kitasatospora sp. NPDC007106]|uniref:RICIN domain-containing protein n=1 Tax=Kitasatospora sp. NPDC007106 TaxID=3156914 RepID=UPI0033FF7731
PARCGLQFALVGDVGVGYGNELAYGSGLTDAAEPAPPPPTVDAPGAELPQPDPVQRFYSAYLRYYVAHAPRRDCRQLAARLGDTVRRGIGDDTLDRHLAKCTACTRARADLTAIHTWQRPALLEGLLLWTGDHEPEPGDTAVLPLPPTGTVPATPPPGLPVPPPPPVPPTPAAPSTPAAPLPLPVPRTPPVPLTPPSVQHRPAPAANPLRRPSDRTIRLALLALGLGILTMAAANISPHRTEPTAATPARPSPSPTTLRATPPPDPSPTALAPSTPATPTTDGNSPSPAPGSPTAQDAPPPSPTPRIPAFRLVNVRSGLCVSPDGGDAAGVHLATCDGSASQRWQFPLNSGGLLQVRNAADGRCLDGTTQGGNVVTVVLRACLTDREEQLWKSVPNQTNTAFRLHFAPCVTKSDYPDHLLGPGDIWPGPAEVGSPLVHQPNYYAKDDFLFTTV